jgi:hypothetical protein
LPVSLCVAGADFEFDFAVADVDEIEAVFGPTPAKTTSEAAPKTAALLHHLA